VNSNQKIINECQKLFDKIKCANHAIYRKPDNGAKSFKNRKPCYQIRIDGFRSVLKVLDTIEPYLIGKKQQAKLVREFVKSRKENMIQRDKLGRVLRLHYTPKEIELMIRVKSLNQGKSSETIRFDLQKTGKI
jgi:hypothetical protein